MCRIHVKLIDDHMNVSLYERKLYIWQEDLEAHTATWKNSLPLIIFYESISRANFVENILGLK